MKLIKKIDYDKMKSYLELNSDRTIVDIYNEIKNKKFRNRTEEEHLLYCFFQLNKRKLGLK